MTRKTIPKLLFVTLPVAALLATTAARADGPVFEITPFGGARMGGGFDVGSEATGFHSVDLDAGASFGLDLGLYRDQQSFYEVLYSTQETSVDSSEPALQDVDVRIDYLQFGGTAFFPQESEHFIPWLSLTIGAAQLSPQKSGYDDETKLAATLGGGFRFPVNDRFAVTAGLRGYLTFIQSDTDLFCASGPENAACLIRSSGSTFFQGEASLGLNFRF